jgi:hypothetical protein
MDLNSSVILVARVWALYGRTKKMLMVFSLAYQICLLPPAAIILRSYLTTSTEQRAPLYHLLHVSETRPLFQDGCYFSVYPKEYFSVYAGSVAFESE